MAGESGQERVPLKAPHVVWASVIQEDQGVCASCFPVQGLCQESLDIPTIRAFVVEGFQHGEGYLI